MRGSSESICKLCNGPKPRHSLAVASTSSCEATRSLPCKRLTPSHRRHTLPPRRRRRSHRVRVAAHTCRHSPVSMSVAPLRVHCTHRLLHHHSSPRTRMHTAAPHNHNRRMTTRTPTRTRNRRTIAQRALVDRHRRQEELALDAFKRTPSTSTRQ